jgi:hypothetical protein
MSADKFTLTWNATAYVNDVVIVFTQYAPVANNDKSQAANARLNTPTNKNIAKYSMAYIP